MIIVDASALFEVVADTPRAELVRARLLADTDHAAPHLVDVEVAAVVVRQHRAGLLDATAAVQAVDDLSDWPGERWPHRPLLARAWELRDTVRVHDALYVALAEALEAPLVTLDGRLARAPGPRCDVDVLG